MSAVGTILAGIAVLNTLINTAAIIIGARTHERIWDHLARLRKEGAS